MAAHAGAQHFHALHHLHARPHSPKHEGAQESQESVEPAVGAAAHAEAPHQRALHAAAAEVQGLHPRRGLARHAVPPWLLDQYLVAARNPLCDLPVAGAAVGHGLLDIHDYDCDRWDRLEDHQVVHQLMAR